MIEPLIQLLVWDELYNVDCLVTETTNSDWILELPSKVFREHKETKWLMKAFIICHVFSAFWQPVTRQNNQVPYGGTLGGGRIWLHSDWGRCFICWWFRNTARVHHLGMYKTLWRMGYLPYPLVISSYEESVTELSLLRSMLSYALWKFFRQVWNWKMLINWQLI